MRVEMAMVEKEQIQDCFSQLTQSILLTLYQATYKYYLFLTSDLPAYTSATVSLFHDLHFHSWIAYTIIR